MYTEFEIINAELLFMLVHKVNWGYNRPGSYSYFLLRQ
jgi:hypothetical protein